MQTEFLQDIRSTGMEDKYLTFQLDDRIYGIEIFYLVEIVAIPEITEIPDMKDYVKGVVDLRGRVVPVFDARLRLGLPDSAYEERTCVIILSIHNKTIGLIVDSVNEVVKIARENVDPLHHSNENNQNQSIKAMTRVKDDVIILLDIERFFAGDHSHSRSDRANGDFL